MTAPFTVFPIPTLQHYTSYTNVNDKGVLPGIGVNGVTNYNNLTSALSGINSAGGGALIFPPGIYNLQPPTTPAGTPAVKLGHNTKLLGAGMGVTTLRMNTANQDVVQMTGFDIGIEALRITSSITMNSGTAGIRATGDKLTLQDLFLDGTIWSTTPPDGATFSGGGLLYDGLVFQGSSSSSPPSYAALAKNIAINFVTHAGIYVTGTTGTLSLTIKDVNQGCKWGASQIAGSATQYGFRCDFTGSAGGSLTNYGVLNSYDNGISATGGNWTMLGCGPDTCGVDDYNFLNCNNIVIKDSWFGATLGTGSNQGNGITVNNCNELEIVGNYGADLNVMGIWVQNSANVLIRGNRCPWANNLNKTVGSGIYLLNNKNFVVTDNIMNNDAGAWPAATLLMKYGLLIDDGFAAGAGPSSWGYVDDNIFHPVSTATLVNNANAGNHVVIGSNNLGP